MVNGGHGGAIHRAAAGSAEGTGRGTAFNSRSLLWAGEATGAGSGRPLVVTAPSILTGTVSIRRVIPVQNARVGSHVVVSHGGVRRVKVRFS